MARTRARRRRWSLTAAGASLLTLLPACASQTPRATFAGLDANHAFARCWAQLGARFGMEHVAARPESLAIEVAPPDSTIAASSPTPARRDGVLVRIETVGENRISLSVGARALTTEGSSDPPTHLRLVQDDVDEPTLELARFVLMDLELAILAAHPEARLIENLGRAIEDGGS